MQDKIKGLIFGQCLGDAVGVVNEFKFKRDNPKVKFPYKYQIGEYPKHDWTDESDQMILIMENITKRGDIKEFAKKLYEWKRHGFEELGDKVGQGATGSINMVVGQQNFLESPILSSSAMWSSLGKHRMACNTAVARTSVLGAIGLVHDEQVFYKTVIDFCRATHYDIRCVFSCIVICSLIHSILKREIVGAKGRAFQMCKRYCPLDGIPVPPKASEKSVYHLDERFVKEGEYSPFGELIYYFNTNFMKISCDNVKTRHYTYTCMSAGLWVFSIIEKFEKSRLKRSYVLNFKKIIKLVAAECGDSDANAAVAGALLGAYVGYHELPRKWIELLPNKQWLDKKIIRFLNTLDVETPRR